MKEKTQRASHSYFYIYYIGMNVYIVVVLKSKFVFDLGKLKCFSLSTNGVFMYTYWHSLYFISNDKIHESPLKGRFNGFFFEIKNTPILSNKK